MERGFKKFLLKSIYISFGITIVIILLHFFLENLYLPAHFLTVSIFFIITNFIYLISIKSLKKEKITAFTNTFMGASAIKLFLLLIYIIAYIFIVKENKVVFLIFVLINYIIFSFLEVTSIVKKRKEL